MKCQYKLHGKPTMNLFLILMLKKTVFLNVKLKVLMIHFNVSQFHGHIFRSSYSQIFFKISALKNFAILRMKKGLQHNCFPGKKQPHDVNILIDFLLKMLG